MNWIGWDKGDHMGSPLRTIAVLMVGLFVCLCHATERELTIANSKISANLVANGGFEEAKQGRASGWTELWTRKPGCGEVTLDREVSRSGSYSARIEHRGAEDARQERERSVRRHHQRHGEVV